MAGIIVAFSKAEEGRNVRNLLMKKGYNVGEISKYAYDSFMYEDYAEAYTEYRTKNLLKGG